MLVTVGQTLFWNVGNILQTLHANVSSKPCIFFSTSYFIFSNYNSNNKKLFDSHSFTTPSANMLLDITIHHGGVVQHNPGLQYVGGLTDEIKNYDVDFLSAWEIEDIVRDLGYVNDLKYWFKMDGNDVEELGKPLTNDEQVVDFLNIVEVYGLTSVHIYVEHRVDEPDIVGEVLFLPPPEGDDEGDAGLGNAEGDAGLGNAGYAVDAENIEGNVNGDAATKPSKKKERVSQKKRKKTKGWEEKKGWCHW